MSLISVVLTLIVVGVLLWLMRTYIPMEPAIKNITVAVVVIAVVIWLLSAYGLFGHVSSIRLR
jgi:ABC-type long-subunit fatty acid transport system fused permease/ATPase subunit